MMKQTKNKVLVSETLGSVSTLTLSPPAADAVLVLGHGAGAGMTHPFMETLAQELAARSIATVRYNFPYMENKKGRPDPPAIAHKTIAAVCGKAHNSFPELPLFAGGKSFGGRMTSQYFSRESPAWCRGILFFGFPLHAIGSPSTERGSHLAAVKVPMLFLQGTRDKMADITLLRQICASLPLATLTTFEGEDHSFHSGKKEVVGQLAEAAALWLKKIVKGKS